MKVVYKLLIVFFVFFVIFGLHLFNIKEGLMNDTGTNDSTGKNDILTDYIENTITTSKNQPQSQSQPQSKLYGSINKVIDRIFNKSKNTYNYCLGGDIMCPSGNLVPVTDSYSGGKTFSYLCDNKTEPICANNYFIEGDASNGYLDYEVGGIEFVFNTQDGFSSPYNTPDAPFVYDMSSNMIQFIHEGNYKDNVDICKFLGSDSRTKNCM
jgi:hypothetical protein